MRVAAEIKNAHHHPQHDQSADQSFGNTLKSHDHSVDILKCDDAVSWEIVKLTVGEQCSKDDELIGFLFPSSSASMAE
jgi:hypothetical protein